MHFWIFLPIIFLIFSIGLVVVIFLQQKKQSDEAIAAQKLQLKQKEEIISEFKNLITGVLGHSRIELDARADNAVEKRIKRAEFPERRSFEQFNLDFNKDLPREEVEYLRDLKFIENNEIALFLGKPGTGKSHLAIALGMSAAQAGHSVYRASVKRLGTKIRKGRELNKLDILFKQILTSKLWILDDWGVVPMPKVSEINPVKLSETEHFNLSVAPLMKFQ